MIENVMNETDQVENFAVCCTANLTIEISGEPFGSSERSDINWSPNVAGYQPLLCQSTATRA
jgi:hypothetical protein